MNRDQLEGKGKEAIGGARQRVRGATGDRGMQAEGATQRTGGKAQGGLGAIMSKIKRLFNR